MADVITLSERNRLSQDVADFVKGMTREESAWVNYWAKIYYDLVSRPEAAPEETLQFINCTLKGALFEYNDATIKAINIIKYFGAHRTIKSYPKPPSTNLKLLQCRP